MVTSPVTASLDGKLHIKDWLFPLNLFLDASKDYCKDVKYTASLFQRKGPALKWWRSFVSLHHHSTFFRRVQMCYTAQVPANWPCDQGTPSPLGAKQIKSVSAVSNLFGEITMQIPKRTDDKRLGRYVRGLKPAIATEACLRRPTTCEEAVLVAERYDEALFSHKAGSSAPHQVRQAHCVKSLSMHHALISSLLKNVPNAFLKDSASNAENPCQGKKYEGGKYPGAVNSIPFHQTGRLLDPLENPEYGQEVSFLLAFWTRTIMPPNQRTFTSNWNHPTLIPPRNQWHLWWERISKDANSLIPSTLQSLLKRILPEPSWIELLRACLWKSFQPNNAKEKKRMLCRLS